MKTKDFNKKTNRCGNVKASFQRFILLMVTIMVSTVLVGCDGEIGNGNGKGRELNANEKELVGELCYSNNSVIYDSYAGTGYSEGIWTDLNKTTASALVLFHYFNADGTYQRIQGASGNLPYTGRFDVKGKWAINSPGIIQVTNITQTYTSNSTKYESYKNKQMPNENIGYVKSTFNGKQGYYLVEDETPEEIQKNYVGTWMRFFVKTK